MAYRNEEIKRLYESAIVRDIMAMGISRFVEASNITFGDESSINQSIIQEFIDNNFDQIIKDVTNGI